MATFPISSTLPVPPLLSPLIRQALQQGASDLHLSSGRTPLLRVDGDLRACARVAEPGSTDSAADDTPLGPADVQSLLHTVMSPAQRQAWSEGQDVDFACELPGLSRLRINAYHQRMGPAAAIRLVPSAVLSLEALQAPALLAHWALRPNGLVLCTGATGSGKSTLLAAMVQHRLQQRADHVLTLEDPIEFVHAPGRGLVSQREIATHAADFALALRSALREDPDVILVGELRDAATIRLALTAAETGHLVLATLHSRSAIGAIDRLIDVFPAAEKDLVRSQLAHSLVGVVAQVLCPCACGPGRVAARELLAVTPAARHLIREHKLAQLVSVMQSGLANGQQTLDQHLCTLVHEKRITLQTAQQHAHHPETLS